MSQPEDSVFITSVLWTTLCMTHHTWAWIFKVLVLTKNALLLLSLGFSVYQLANSITFIRLLSYQQESFVSEALSRMLSWSFSIFPWLQDSSAESGPQFKCSRVEPCTTPKRLTRCDGCVTVDLAVPFWRVTADSCHALFPLTLISVHETTRLFMSNTVAMYKCVLVAAITCKLMLRVPLLIFILSMNTFRHVGSNSI
jgi:hypothetical protein